MNQTKGTFVIACGVLGIDIRHLLQDIDIHIKTHFLQGGLHENPAKLRSQLQEAIDNASKSGKWDRIAIGYGICGRGTVGIRAQDIPLAIPKVHDCISLFLGSNTAYKKEFKRYPGTYYVSAGWHEEKIEPLSQKRPYAYMGETKVYYDELVQKFGETHAKETFKFLNSWKRNYQRAAFIDTGGDNTQKYAEYARKMAEKYGWKYEALKGSLTLLKKLLTANTSTDEILIVQPNHVTVFDAREGGLKASPVLAYATTKAKPQKKIEMIEFPRSQSGQCLQTGLGIDAGGTYTDAVVFDFATQTVRCKNKALTTKWDFTVGILEALTGLDKKLLPEVELVALSTTLATNAVVEGEGQKVGLLLMPPYGLFEPQDILYEPKALIDGQIEITGKIIAPVNETKVRQIGRRMVEKNGVEAFAVSGFAGSINPEHELQVKQILRDETGLFVTCGHELSHMLNFKTRAQTAILNARIVPRLVKLLQDLHKVLGTLGIIAPVMVVKGDGSLMSSAMAMERPVETILSGPAASVAGAHFLTDEKDAIVVDMGGTTTDTAALENGRVQVCDNGSNLGGYRTHVNALEIRTSGLGGDSLIVYDKGVFEIGPRRVAPVAWVGKREPGLVKALEHLRSRMHLHMGSSRAIQIFTLAGYNKNLELNDLEAEIVALLSQRPHSLYELVEQTNTIHPAALPLTRLEKNFIIQRCGLTPTDLLHINGQFTRWDKEASRKMCALFAAVSGISPEELVTKLLNLVVRQLTLELIKKQLDTETQPDEMDACKVCQVLVNNFFNSNSKDYSVRFELHRSIIGIGAPINHFLPQAAEMLGANAILPEHSEVANAIGAITSHIAVHRQVKIKPDEAGGFLIEGLAGAKHFEKFKEAESYAKKALGKMVLDVARTAGTSETAIEMHVEDRTANTSQGYEIFLEQNIIAHLIGQPDIPSLGSKSNNSYWQKS